MSLVLTLEKVHLSGQCVSVRHGSTTIRHVWGINERHLLPLSRSMSVGIKAFCQLCIDVGFVSMQSDQHRINNKYCFASGVTSDLLFPLGKEKNQTHHKGWTALLHTYKSRQSGRRQTQTSIKPNHHTSEHTDAPYHQGVNVEQIRRGGAAK